MTSPADTSISIEDSAANERLSLLRKLASIRICATNEKPGPDEEVLPASVLIHIAEAHGERCDGVPEEAPEFAFRDENLEPVSHDAMNAVIAAYNAATSLCDFAPLGPLDGAFHISEEAGYRLRISEVPDLNCGDAGVYEFAVDTPYGEQEAVLVNFDGHSVIAVGIPADSE